MTTAFDVAFNSFFSKSNSKKKGADQKKLQKKREKYLKFQHHLKSVERALHEKGAYHREVHGLQSKYFYSLCGAWEGCKCACEDCYCIRYNRKHPLHKKAVRGFNAEVKELKERYQMKLEAMGDESIIELSNEEIKEDWSSNSADEEDRTPTSPRFD